MDSDFHYYGTGTAALAAGFSRQDARLVANAAQFVDWFDSDYWSNWRIVDRNHRPVRHRQSRQIYCYANPQISIQKIDWKMLFDYDMHLWNAFHFPPGNIPWDLGEDDEPHESGGWRRQFHRQHRVRQTRLTRRDAGKLCRPFSRFALDLIDNTLQLFEQLVDARAGRLTKLIEQLVAPRIRCPATNGRKLALMLLGLRMHVLADTWAHQDFTGEQNYDINNAGFFNEVTAKDAAGRYRATVWTGTVWALHDDTDCAAAPPPAKGVDGPCAGHGQMGHYPDYSWLTFRYPAGWLPTGRRFHTRENPTEYQQAWRWLSFAMSLCRGTANHRLLSKGPPKDITRVIETWHPLSTEGLEAIEASERLWRSTRLGTQLAPRWNPVRRGSLGLRDGLAVTRFGSIDVKRDSVLHLMELAASIHYQFCVDWQSRHPEYDWTPPTPLT